jgi:predicted Rossmann fold nucleotide-binding protein DprA/Smf involved in DNA uptake
MITPDGQAILLLCSHLGLSGSSELAPMTLREWNPLARKILASPLKRPSALLEWPAQELTNALELTPEEAARIQNLLARSGMLAIELERLASIGIRPVTRADADYPARLKQRLKDSAPPVLFYSGNLELLGQPGLAVVGSRHLDQTGQDCAKFVGDACGISGLVLYSGGAKGVDTISIQAALENRGTAVGILADSLERAIRIPENRAALSRGDLCLATPYAPSAGFSVGAAMGRNKLIYALADYALVVASDAEKGGTWAGATEALKAGWAPVYILKHTDMPEGNRLLLQRGGLEFPYPFTQPPTSLPAWLGQNSKQDNKPLKPVQLGLL